MMLILRQSTYVVKSHSLYNDKSFFDFSTLQLVLIRNPFLAIVSNYNLKQSGNNKGKAEPRHFHSEPWRKYVNVSTSLWKKKYLHWLQWYQNQTIIVVYEHLRDSLQFELLKLAKFLRLSVNPVRLKCLLDHPFGKYKRVKPNVEAIFPFTLHETKVIARAICEVDRSLQERFNTTLPIDTYIRDLNDRFRNGGNKRSSNLLPNRIQCSNK